MTDVSLGTIAAEAAMRGALDHIRTHQLQYDPAELNECLFSWIKIKLPEGLSDAEEAIEAGMIEIGQQTFLETMLLAGIEAAKEAGSPTA